MARLFHNYIPLLCCFIVYVIPAAVLAFSPSNYRVKTVIVGSDVEIPCINGNSSLSTYFRYSSDPNAAEAAWILRRSKGQGVTVDKRYKGRVSLHNSTKIILLNVQVNDTGIYRCNVFFETGRESINQVALKIGVAPTIEPLKSIAVLEESSVTIPCNVQGQPSPNVSWVLPGFSQNRVIARSYLLKLKHITTSQSGEYICRAENFMGVTEGILRINVYEKPRIREFFHNGSLDGVVWEYQDVKLQCEVAYDHALPIQNYKLYQNDRLMIKQSNSGVFVISRVGLQHAGNYTCVPETSLGQGRNKSLRIYVKAQSKHLRSNSPSTHDILSRTVVTVAPVTQADKNESAHSGSAEYHGSTFMLTFLWFLLPNFLTLYDKT